MAAGARLKPPAPPDAQRVQRLLRDLDSEDFNVRATASADLQALGEPVARGMSPGGQDGVVPGDAAPAGAAHRQSRSAPTRTATAAPRGAGAGVSRHG